jgi:hypothetical protein
VNPADDNDSDFMKEGWRGGAVEWGPSNLRKITIAGMDIPRWYKVDALNVCGIFKATVKELATMINLDFQYKPSYQAPVTVDFSHLTFICLVSETPFDWSCGDDPVSQFKETQKKFVGIVRVNSSLGE